jgi:hypothetical protein
VDIYRDSQLLGNVSHDNGVFEFSDTIPGNVEHEYWAVSKFAEGDSPESIHRLGCAAQWSGVELDPVGEGDETYSSAAMIGGKPAALYFRGATGELVYAYSDANPPSNWQAFDSGVDTGPGARTSLIEFQGLPYYAMALESPGLVYVGHFENTAPDDVGDIDEHVAAVLTAEGKEVCLAEVNDRLALLIHDESESVSYYVFADTASPESTEDWFVALLHTLHHAELRRFDLAEIDGLPAVAIQTDTQVYFLRANTPTPLLGTDWTEHLVTEVTSGGGTAAGVDLTVVDGLPYLAAVWGQLEQTGQVLYLLPAGPTIPDSSDDWAGVVVAELNDQEPRSVSLAFDAGIPWVVWQDGREGTPFIARPQKHQLGFLNDPWHTSAVPGLPEFEQCRRESSLLSLDGVLGVFYITDDNATDAQAVFYASLLPCP